MHQDDEIDLFELFSDLWDGKWAILSATLIAICIGGAYSVVKERKHVVKYQSIIAFTSKNLPPFLDSINSTDPTDSTDPNVANDAFFEFRALFHSKSDFEAWKASNSEAQIDFDDISLTKVIEGVELSFNSKLVSLEANGLKVNTNDLQVLDSFYDYLSSLNEKLTRQYIARTRAEIAYIERRFKDFWSADDALQDQVLVLLQHANEVRTLERYVDRAQNGAYVLEISRPTIPVVTSATPKTKLIMALSVVLGAFVGIAYVLLRNAIRRRRETLSET